MADITKIDAYDAVAPIVKGNANRPPGLQGKSV
jgi:hypothetical protein